MKKSPIQFHFPLAAPQGILLTIALLLAFPATSPSARQKPAQTQTAPAVVDEWFKLLLMEVT